MEKVAPNSKFLGYSTEIIRQTKIKGPLLKYMALNDLSTKIESKHGIFRILALQNYVVLCETMPFHGWNWHTLQNCFMQNPFAAKP